MNFNTLNESFDRLSEKLLNESKCTFTGQIETTNIKNLELGKLIERPDGYTTIPFTCDYHGVAQLEFSDGTTQNGVEVVASEGCVEWETAYVKELLVHTPFSLLWDRVNAAAESVWVLEILEGDCDNGGYIGQADEMIQFTGFSLSDVRILHPEEIQCSQMQESLLSEANKNDNGRDDLSLDYKIAMQKYPNSKKFISRDSAEYRDLLDILEGSGIEHFIYDDKYDNGCTVFYESFSKSSQKNLNEDLKYDISGRVEIEKVTGIKFTSIEEESHGSYDVDYTANIQGIADLTVNGIAFDSIPVVAHTGYACYDLEEGITKSLIREFIVEDLTEGGLDAHYLCDIFDGSLSAEEQEADNFNGSLVFDLRVKNKKDIEKIKRAIELPTQESLLTEKMDNDGFTPEEAEVYWDLNHEGDAILAEFDDFADWYEYLRENNWINEDEVIDDLIIYAEDVLEEYMEMYEGESWHKIVYEAAKKAYECFSERGQDVGPFDKKRMIRIIADGLPSTKKEYLDRFLRLKKGQREKAIKSYELSKYKNDKLYQSESLQESEIGATAYASYNGPDVYGDGYAVFGYYDEDCRALADSNWCSNWEEVQDLVHSYISKGDVVRIINNETGNDIIITLDEYFDNFEGDFPIAPQDVEEGHMWNRTAKLDSFDLGLDESLNKAKVIEILQKALGITKQAAAEYIKNHSEEIVQSVVDKFLQGGKKPVTEALFDYRTTKDVYGYSANDILQMTEKVLGLSQKEAVKYLNSHSEEDVQAIIDEATKHLYKNAGEKDKYWYFTRHGQGPGTFPRDAVLLDWVEDDDFNTWIALDRMLTDEEMAEFELREQTPPDLEEGVLGTALKVAGAVGSVGSAIADAVGSLKEDSEIKPRRKFMGKKSVIKR